MNKKNRRVRPQATEFVTPTDRASLKFTGRITHNKYASMAYCSGARETRRRANVGN